MNIKDKIIKLSEKNYSIEEIQQISNSKSLKYVKEIIKNHKFPVHSKLWNSINFWRIITLFSVLLSIIFFVFPSETYSVLEFIKVKQTEKADINLELFTIKEGRDDFKIPVFLNELNLNKTKMEAFTIIAPATNTLEVENIHFWIKPIIFGKVGIVYIKRMKIPRETHIYTENLRYFDYNNISPVKYIPFIDINPSNVQERYKTIINKTILGAETFDLSISRLKPREFLNFLIYYHPNNLSNNNTININDFYWDVCYDYVNNGKKFYKCVNNTQTIPDKQGRTVDYMIPAEIIW